jgi:hypothetical protein
MIVLCAICLYMLVKLPSCVSVPVLLVFWKLCVVLVYRLILSLITGKMCIGPFGHWQTYCVYICIVHTIVLFQSLVGVYRWTQHVKYCYEQTTLVTCFGLHYSHLQALCKRSNEHWLLHLYLGDTLFTSVIKILIISCS